jgi:hypothetical protein
MCPARLKLIAFISPFIISTMILAVLKPITLVSRADFAVITENASLINGQARKSLLLFVYIRANNIMQEYIINAIRCATC